MVVVTVSVSTIREEATLDGETVGATEHVSAVCSVCRADVEMDTWA